MLTNEFHVNFNENMADMPPYKTMAILTRWKIWLSLKLLLFAHCLKQ